MDGSGGSRERRRRTGDRVICFLAEGGSLGTKRFVYRKPTNRLPHGMMEGGTR